MVCISTLALAPSRIPANPCAQVLLLGTNFHELKLVKVIMTTELPNPDFANPACPDERIEYRKP